MLLLFAGYAAGSQYNIDGSGSNYLCLHKHPQWKTYIDGGQNSGKIYGVEYELYQSNNVFSLSNNGGNLLHNNPAPCAVCYVGGRSTVLMVPARRLPVNSSHGQLVTKRRSTRHTILGCDELTV